MRSTAGEGGYVYETGFYYIKNGETRYLTGNELRSAIGTGVMRSHCFEVTDYDPDSKNVTFTVNPELRLIYRVKSKSSYFTTFVVRVFTHFYVVECVLLRE